MDAHWPYHTEASLQSPADYAGAWRDMVLMHGAYHEHHPGADVMERVLGMYDEAIAFVDQQIGRLLATLDAMDVRDQTLVAITADHGEEFFEHGRWQHGASRKMYDELLRVPLIVEIPGQPGRVDIPQQVALLDLPVTILDAVGLPSDPRMEGKSLLSARAGQPDPARGVVISEMVALEGLCVALRTEAYKYVYVEQEPHRRELYDLEADPEERDNLYGTRPTVERAFQEILDKHLEQGKRTGSRGEDGQWLHDDEVVRRLRALGYID
jgi:arylsulfatase